MQPNPLRWQYQNHIGSAFGEVNEHNKGHGRVISLNLDGKIWTGYAEKGVASTGNYIAIFSNGEFYVGEEYRIIGMRQRWDRGTKYYTDGTEEESDTQL